MNGGTVLVVVDQAVQCLFLGIACFVDPCNDLVDFTLYLLVGCTDTTPLLVDDAIQLVPEVTQTSSFGDVGHCLRTCELQ